MLLALFALGLLFMVLFSVRTVLVWTVPKPALAKIDRATGRAFKLFFQLTMIAGTLILVYCIWAVATGH